MTDSAHPSQYWGTGWELSDERAYMDDARATEWFILVSQRIFGPSSRFVYDAVEFRSLFHPVEIWEVFPNPNEPDVVWQIIPLDHWLSEDGKSDSGLWKPPGARRNPTSEERPKNPGQGVR